MNAEEIRNYGLDKNDVSESFPFGVETFVYKVNNKIFMLMNLTQDSVSINLKCNPEKAVDLREEYPEIIIPGYHMNKMHWNTVFPQNLRKELVIEMIDESYNLVFKKKK